MLHLRPLLCGLVSLLAASAQAQDIPAASTHPDLNLRHTVVVDVVARTKDAVVCVSTTKLIRTSPFGGDPFFRQFLQQDVQAQSLGSGFFVHENGYLITNNHVVDRAREIIVELAEGRKLPADLVASDPEGDLAVLKVKSDRPLPYLNLGDSSDLLIGEPVIAVGNPLGYSHSVSTGIVSAVHRKLEDATVKLEDLVQTDAAINPGNSGGPLLNAYGQVIGINTAVRGDAQNIGFAIQVNRLRELIPALLNPQQAGKINLPISLTETRQLHPPAQIEVQVRCALSNGEPRPLASINGKRPRDIVDACAIVLATRSGESMRIGFVDGTQQSLVARAVAPPDAIVQAHKRLGVQVELLTPRTAAKYGVAVEDGMLVTEVRKDAPAGRAGLQPGDVITALGNHRVETLEDFANLLQYVPTSGRVRVEVVRGSQQGYLVLRLEP